MRSTDTGSMPTIELPEHKKRLYRIYIDEVGNHTMKEALSENERFLTLFGVWISLDHVLNVIQPEMHAIKYEFFQSDPDEPPVVFHRKEIARFQGPYSVLYGDKERRRAFGDRMLRAYQEWQYSAVVVTIDKAAHFSKYQAWRYEPYHFCMAVLLERYTRFLERRGLQGDVMAESRFGTLNDKLKDSFTGIFDKGTRYVPARTFQSFLTSRQLKLKPKKANIAGLQLADLLAHPAQYGWRKECGLVERQASEYGIEIVQILDESKYDRDPGTGNMVGWGKKLLPKRENTPVGVSPMYSGG